MPDAVRRLLSGSGFSALALCACASAVAPGAIVASAQDAVARADQESVVALAPLLLEGPRVKLYTAQVAMRARRNVEARRMAEQATVDAELAVAAAKRERLKLAMTELSRALDVLQREPRP